jgi:alkylated DNA nucleotide flippase Atl1
MCTYTTTTDNENLFEVGRYIGASLAQIMVDNNLDWHRAIPAKLTLNISSCARKLDAAVQAIELCDLIISY